MRLPRFEYLEPKNVKEVSSLLSEKREAAVICAGGTDSGNDVMITGFGKWTSKKKKERKDRNPQTCEIMTIAARKVVTFKTSPILRDKVND